MVFINILHKKFKAFKNDYQNEDKETFSSIDSSMLHSSYYHKKYEGYMEKVVINEKGKKRIERVYTGSYYSQEIPKNRRVIIRAAYVLLYLFSVVLFTAISVRLTESNLSKYVQFISFLVLISSFFMFLFLMKYLSSPVRMTISEYTQGPIRMKFLSLTTSILMAVQMLAVGVFMLLSKEANLADEMINMTGYIIAACLMYVIFHIESRIPYEKTPSKDSFFKDGYYIDH